MITIVFTQLLSTSLSRHSKSTLHLDLGKRCIVEQPTSIYAAREGKLSMMMMVSQQALGTPKDASTFFVSTTCENPSNNLGIKTKMICASTIFVIKTMQLTTEAS